MYLSLTKGGVEIKLMMMCISYSIDYPLRNARVFLLYFINLHLLRPSPPPLLRGQSCTLPYDTPRHCFRSKEALPTNRV